MLGCVCVCKFAPILSSIALRPIRTIDTHRHTLTKDNSSGMRRKFTKRYDAQERTYSLRILQLMGNFRCFLSTNQLQNDWNYVLDEHFIQSSYGFIVCRFNKSAAVCHSCCFYFHWFEVGVESAAQNTLHICFYRCVRSFPPPIPLCRVRYCTARQQRISPQILFYSIA